ncbi:TetR/AcrR family transcriptional regulator [Xanthobacter flavus]|uniref:TetR/AcrR family transcriptional regulator n=1 Tax=Xanthobacter flavus TaxID=281 RepID=UPI00372A9645
MLDAAAIFFAERGYHATAMRDIARVANVTPGAVYFHVATKHALLVAVYQEGVDRIIRHFDEAIAEEHDPVKRFRCAIQAHLESILDESAYARVIVRVLPEDVPEATEELKRQRERYEERFRALIDGFRLPQGRNPKLMRLLLIGALNWTPVWYRGSIGGLDPVVDEMVASFGIQPTRRTSKK